MEQPRACGPNRATMPDSIECNHKSIMEAFVARKIDTVAAGSEWDAKRGSSMSPPPSFVWRRRHRPSESDASSIASSALSIAAPSILSSISPPPTATLSPTFTISSHEQHGWTTPKMRARGMSIASLEVPAMTNSLPESAVSSKHQSVMKPLPPLPPPPPPPLQQQQQQQQQQQPQPAAFGEITIPHRPKRRKHRQSWDSGYRSQMSGLHTRGNSVDEGGPAWPSIHRQQQLLRDREAMPPPAPPAEQQQQQPQQQQRVPSFNSDTLDILESSATAPSTAMSPESDDEDEGVDVDETSSDTTMPAEDAAGRVLNYAVDVALGLGAHDAEIDNDPACRTVVHNFFSDLQWAISRSHQQQNDSDQQPSRTVSSASNGSRASRRSSGKSKRKTREGADEDGGDDGTEEGGGGGSKGREPGPAKRAKLESPVRMNCPYRKKNPLRFNVRDHRLCALTVFTDTAELRRHIQDYHKRPHNLPQHRCPRCQTQFSNSANLREHLLFRDNVLCEIVDAAAATDADLAYRIIGDRGSTGSSSSSSSSGSSNSQIQFDPEDGIDAATAEKLRSKKGRVSDSIEVQWLKIWELLFPDTEVLPYEYVAVIEHHELHAKYRESLPVLRGSLSAIGLGDRGLETLDHILTNHLIDLFEQCNEEGRRKDYRNRYRQSARASTVAPAVQSQQQQSQQQQQHQQQQQQQQPSTTQLRKQSSLRQRLATAQRDSGFVDEESLMEGGITPALTSDDGSSPGYAFAKPGDMLTSSVSPPQHFPGYSPGMDSMMLPGAAGSFADPSFSDYLVPTGHESGDLGLQYGGLGEFQPFGQGMGMYGAGVSGAEMPWLTSMTIGAGDEDLGVGQHDNTSAWVYGQPS